MSIANAIRYGVLYDSDTLSSDEVLNEVLSAFMQQGDWLATWTHALTFALFVAEELDGGSSSEKTK